MQRTVSAAHLLALLLQCWVINPAFAQQRDFTQYVNPFIGTDRMGHTFPGAAAPFGFVQLSPDTDTVSYAVGRSYNRRVYEYCAGYQYRDPTIVGFSHTHFSGTGHSDLGDFLVMPVSGALRLEPGSAADPTSGYRSRFRHESEEAHPGYYRVRLDDHAVTAELTATERVGFHRYNFERGGEAHVILDLIHGIYNHPDKNVWSFVRVENARLVTGWRQTSGWARTRTLYFAMEFDRPFTSYGHAKYDSVVYRGFWRKFAETRNFPEMAGRALRVFFDFALEDGATVQVKVALSAISAAGALANLRAEAPHWDFQRTRAETTDKWNAQLGKVDAAFATDDERTVFYTALYHACLAPTVFQDTDGRYRGLDQEIHHAEGFTNHTVFSLWDTFRALHPLFTLLEPARTRDMIASMLAHQRQSVHGMLPVWSHHANENWCMTGYHAVSVIADAAVKNVYRGDLRAALDACTTTATYEPFDGLGEYLRLGYVPQESFPYSVSATLEYAYDDWTIAQLARRAGDEVTAKSYLRRAGSWRRHWDASIGFMRPRHADGSWAAPFDPLDTHGQGFIEGNAWNYGLFVPHDVEGLVETMGGRVRFARVLDSLFEMGIEDRHIVNTEDITRDGIIGAYVHGNEPGHHIPYLYNWTSAPWKAGERVRMILARMYNNRPDGLCGNDDCGQMSAWYIFSALGFYPVAPGSDRYWFGAPSVRSAVLQLDDGRRFEVAAPAQAGDHVYVTSVLLNGRALDRRYITHAEIVAGGRLEFMLSPRPPAHNAEQD